MQLEKNLAEFRQAEAEVVAVAVQSQAEANKTAVELNVSYPILADPQHQVAAAYGVYNLLHDNVAAPSVFVINKAGEIVWSYVGKDINDRPDNRTILANLPAAR